MLVAMGAVALAIVGTGDDGDAGGVKRAERVAPAPAPQPPRDEPSPRERSEKRDEKGYPEGTKRDFVDICEDRTPLGKGDCGCVYDRLHDEYTYDEFSDLLGQINPETREVPDEILEHVVRCRLPG